MKPLVKVIPFTKALDGARVLFRYFLSTSPAREGHIREFSPCEQHVRISLTNGAFDTGMWFRVSDMRIEAILEEKPAAVVPNESVKEEHK